MRSHLALFAGLSLSSLLSACGFFRSVSTSSAFGGSAPQTVVERRREAPDYAPELAKSPIDQLNLSWVSDDLKISGVESEGHARECVKLCEPSNWLRLEFAFKEEVPLFIPSRIASGIGLRGATKITVRFEPKQTVKKPDPAFSCSYARVAAEFGKPPNDYTLASCSNGKKASALVKAQNILASLEQSGLPEKLSTYTIGKHGSLKIACLNLPADPGDAGKKTLEGIDADKDGVRDDIQRWVQTSLVSSEKARLSALQVAKYVQSSLLSSADKARSISETKKLMNAQRCASLAMNDSQNTTVIGQVESLMYNTKARTLAASIADKNFSGQSFIFTSGNEKSTCEFNIDAVRN